MNTAALRRIRYAGVLLASLASGYFVLTFGSAGSTATLVTASGEHAIEVEVADTPDKRETGLMNRDSMAADTGMLFEFGEARPVSMWMKNTLIPLDMIFMDENGVIVNIAENARPLSLDIIPSNGAVHYVLELNGGAAAGYGAKPGDRLVHPDIGH